MKKINLSCDECEASFTITHDMSIQHYIPEYCPFCGETLQDEDRDEEESDLDDEEFDDEDE